MTHTMRRRALVAGAVAAALVATIVAPSTARAQDVPMPSEQVLGSIPYMNGGVGEEEVDFVKREMKDYTLRLAFSRAGSPRAEYVAGVAVTITDAKGTNVFELASAGPYLLLKVAPGRYSLTAAYENQTTTRPVVAAKGNTPINIVWK